MTATLRRLRFPRLLSPTAPVTELALALVLTLGITLGATVSRSEGMARYLVGGLGGIILFVISTTGRLTALRLAVLWLTFLGLTRRILIPFAGWSDNDPLLLVGPAVAAMLWLSGRKRAPKRRDGLTAAVLFFLFWTAAQVFNPLQGSLLNGLLGLIFWLPPLLWFFVGRTFALRTHVKIVTLIVVLAIPVALHGQRQVYFGLFPFEYTWLGFSDFGAAVFVNGFNVRPFASMTSPQEYGAFLAFALPFLWATILARHRFLFLRIGLFGFLGWALFMQGTRSIFAFFVISLGLTAIVWARGAMRVAVLAILIGIAGWVQTLEPPSNPGQGLAQGLIHHQLSGLLDPFGAGSDSTAGIHRRLILNGFERAWDQPMGFGLSSTTIVYLRDGAKFNPLATEADFGEVFVSFGIPAGIAYLFFIVMAFAAAARRFRANRSPYSLAVIGVLVAGIGHIWTGGLYAVSSFMWFTLGGLTRPAHEELEEEEEEEPAGEALQLPLPPGEVDAAA